MAEMEKKAVEGGIKALADNELDAVAGGVDFSDWLPSQEIKTLAASEGRAIQVPVAGGALCPCPPSFYFAESFHTKSDGRKVYLNAKCYKCGRELVSIG